MAPMTAYAGEVGNLRSRVLRGAAWTTGAAVVVQASRLLFGVALARLLTPHEYGLAGMALVFSALVVGIADVGLGAGLVQRRAITEADRSTVFWTTLTLGCVLTAAGIGLSWPIADFFGEPAVQPLFAAVSTGFVVVALGRVHAVLLQRDMAFKAISLRVMAATTAGGVVAVTLAALGFGPWALVGMNLSNGVVTTVLLWTFSSWHPQFTFSLASLRDLGAYGLNVFGSRIFEYVQGNADKVLVGRLLGASALGLYNVAFNLVVLPFLALVLALVDALFPAMARVQDDPARVAAAWLRATRMLVAITVPAMLGVVIVAPEFVAVVLGDQWTSAVEVLQLLAFAMVVHGVVAFSTTVLMALNRTGLVLRFMLCEVTVTIGALLVGLQWGIVGVAAAYVVAVAVMRSILGWLTARTLGISPLAPVRAVTGVVQAALVMMAVAWGARLTLLELDAPAVLRLALVPAIGAIVYLPLCAARAPELVSDFQANARFAAAGRLLGRARELLPR
jgi:O-antigen/teichoic acid export membrane protein